MVGSKSVRETTIISSRFLKMLVNNTRSVKDESKVDQEKYR